LALRTAALVHKDMLAGKLSGRQGGRTVTVVEVGLDKQGATVDQLLAFLARVGMDS